MTKEAGTAVVPGKTNMDISPPFSPLPSTTHATLPVTRGASSHRNGHRVDWLDHTRETVLSTVPAAGPADFSHSLTMDTNALPVAGKAVFI